MSAEKMYSIPYRFRKTENLHIVFWLLKDVCWAMTWRTVGIAMLVPTLTVAILITWQTRKLKSELYHNLAVTFWIMANGFWMIVEFFGMDEQLRIFTLIPFSLGIIVITIYYAFILLRERKTEKMVTISVDVPENTLKVAEARYER